MAKTKARIMTTAESEELMELLRADQEKKFEESKNRQLLTKLTDDFYFADFEENKILAKFGITDKTDTDFLDNLPTKKIDEKESTVELLKKIRQQLNDFNIGLLVPMTGNYKTATRKKSVSQTAFQTAQLKNLNTAMLISNLRDNAVEKRIQNLNAEISKYQKKKFAENLKSIRQEKGLTQEEVAQKMFIAPQNYAAYEQGRREPRITTLLSLSKALEIAPNELLNIY